MSSFYGNYRLIIRDVNWYFGRVLFLYITFPLMLAWIIIGMVFNLSPDVIPGISIHVYVNIAILALVGFKTIFPIAIGMGSTRQQFLKTFYATGLGTVLFVILLLNISQLFLATVYNRMLGWSNLMHPAVLFRSSYQFLPYFWIDLMLALFLFGFSFLVFCLWYRLGLVAMFSILMSLAIAGLFLYYSGILGPGVERLWQAGRDSLLFFAVPGLAGLAILLGTYPLMRDAPLEPKPRKG
jgi:hypothetical protein